MQIQRQSLVQHQRLTLSPRLVQSIKLMSLPFADLREQILEEVDQNPALEVVSDPFTTAEWQFPDSTVRQSTASGGDDESDEHRDFIEGVLHRDCTLQEYLLEQLSEMTLPPDLVNLASLIIQNLGPEGFHQAPPTELPGAENPGLLERALQIVRELEPRGCACSGFQESLAVQARLLRTPSRNSPSLFVQDPLLEATIEILEHHFDALEKGRPDALIKALRKKGVAYPRLDEDEAAGVFEIVRSLDPFPGRQFSREGGSYVVPDVIVKKTEDDYSIVINEEEIPVVGLSPFFLDVEKERTEDSETRNFVRESVREARWFLDSLNRRNMTILKLCRAIVVFQRDFFVYGPSRLAPLRMKDVASEIGMHEATVSRAANGKYLQCEWGIFELRHFFSNSVGSVKSSSSSARGSAPAHAAGRYSKEGVKEMVRTIIEESGDNLSDQKISDILSSRGIKLARRTVAKYRSELTIKSSFER